jgi:plastocyanin
MLRRFLVTALVAAAAVGLAACGSDNNDSASSTPAPAATTPAPASTTATSGGTTLAVAADPSGQLAYDKKALSAPAGQITIDFTNDSQVPHNVTIEQGQTESGATDTIQKSKTSKAFTLTTGTYTFYCSVGNHESAGMKGTLTVQ